MKTQLLNLKTELKKLAQEIKTNRPLWKESQRQGKYEWKYNPINLASDFRHKHIAYCLLRGRTLEQIERSNRDGNKPNMGIVERIMKEIQNEALRDSQSGPKQESTSSASGTCVSPVLVGTPPNGVEQRDSGIPQSPKLGFIDRAKEFFGLL